MDWLKKHLLVIDSAVIATLLLTIGCWLVFMYQHDVGQIRQHQANAQRRQTQLATNRHRQRAQTTNRTNNYADRGWRRLGTVVVPSLHIVLPIYDQPMSKTALAIGAQQLSSNNGQQKVSNALNSGDTVLIAHNYADAKTMFSPLQQFVNEDRPYLVNRQSHANSWLKGRQAIVADAQGITVYQLGKQKAVKATDLHVAHSSKHNELRLITCLYPSDNYRIVTYGTESHRYSWTQAPISTWHLINSHNYNIKR